jgi:hypothetical protein
MKIKPSFIGTIRVSSISYRRDKNLIHTITKSGCSVSERITEDTATHLSLQAEALKGSCDDMREIFEIRKNQPPWRYRKIKH